MTDDQRRELADRLDEAADKLIEKYDIPGKLRNETLIVAGRKLAEIKQRREQRSNKKPNEDVTTIETPTRSEYVNDLRTLLSLVRDSIVPMAIGKEIGKLQQQSKILRAQAGASSQST